MSMDNTNPVVLLQRLNRWRMAFFGLTILIAGVAIGFGSGLIWARQRIPTKMIGPKPPGVAPVAQHPASLLIQKLRGSLRLSESQYKQIEPVVREHMITLARIREEAKPKVVEQLRQMNDGIVAVLDEPQKKMWRAHFRQLQEQFQIAEPVRRWQPGPGPVGPQSEAPGFRRKGTGPQVPPGTPPADGRDKAVRP